MYVYVCVYVCVCMNTKLYIDVYRIYGMCVYINLEICNLEVNTGNGYLYNMVAKGNMKNMIH